MLASSAVAAAAMPCSVFAWQPPLKTSSETGACRGPAGHIFHGVAGRGCASPCINIDSPGAILEFPFEFRDG